MWPSTIDGSPAFGRQLIGNGEWFERCRRCSVISLGPVAQFSPNTSGSIAPSAASAAPISVPSSMRPVVSIVTCTCSGTTRPSAAIARRAPIIAAFAWSRS